MGVLGTTWRALLAGLVGTAALAVPAQASTSQAAAAPHQRAGRVAVAPEVRRVTRGYHDRVVKMATRRQRLVLSFRGTRGDRVELLDESWFPYELCARITLRHDGRRVARNDLGHFRLPRTGAYVFRYTPCRTRPRVRTLRLTLVDTVRPTVDVRRLPRRRGVLHAAVVRVPRSGMLALSDPTGAGFAAVGAGGKVREFNGSVPNVVLRAGHRPLAADADNLRSYRQARTAAGQRVALLTRGGGAVVAGAPVQHPTTYDGPAVAPEGPLPQALPFDGRAGDWLQSQDGVRPEDESYRSVLVGPDGTALRPSPIHPGLWRLPVTGSYTLLFLRDPRLPPLGAAAALRAAGVTVLPPLRTDDPPTTFAPPAPGRAVIAPTATGGYLRLSRTYPGGPVAAYGGFAEAPVCPPSGPLGCGDGASVTVSTDQTTSWFPFSGWVYVPFAVADTAPIDLQLVSGP